MSRGLTLLVLAASIMAPASATAYNASEVHPWIARQAVAHLVSTYPGKYDEAYKYVDAIARGARHEDDLILDGDTDPTTVRLFRHFYNPIDHAGLSVEPFGSFLNSYLWGGADNQQNAWGWTDAFGYYAAGDVEEAYFALGHVVHLLSDLTVPAHVHLDAHGPPSGDDYEDYCAGMTVNQYESMLPLPPPGAPVLEAADLEALWQATALASYWRNSYPGVLDRDAGPSGALVEMFGDRVEFSELSQKWEIDGVGALGKGFHEHQPGHFYFEQLDALPLVDRVNFDPAAYDQVELGATGEVMAAGIARDMIPLAILASAAAIKMFIDSDPQIDPTEPDLEPPPEMGGCSAASGAPSGAFALLLLTSLCLGVRRRN